MAKQPNVLQYLRELTGLPGTPSASDRALLERFTTAGDGSAFATLLHRYRSLVMGTCRRVLRDEHAAEDAFQATFLILARKAGSIRGEMLGTWLHRVAYHVALRAKVGAARRQTEERQVPTPRPTQTADDLARQELRNVLDAELEHLPSKYRLPVVLHYLEGKTKEETAQQLGWTEGTVSGRLARARDVLRQRLARRGLALSAAALATALSQEAVTAAVSPGVLTAALRGAMLVAAGQAVAVAGLSTQAVTLADATLRTMRLTARLRLALGALVLTGLLIGGVGVGMALVAPRTTEARLQAALDSRSGVTWVAFSADNQTVVLASTNRTVTLWDVPHNRQRLVIGDAGPDAYPFCAAFSPDGQTLAVGYQDRRVRLWNTATGIELAVLVGHTDSVVRLVFAADGKFLASSAGWQRDGEVIVWDLAAARPQTTIPIQGAVETLAITADSVLALHRNPLVGLKMWDRATGREKPLDLPAQFGGQYVMRDGQVIDVGPASNCLDISPDAHYLVLVRSDRFVYLWDMLTREERVLFRVPWNGSAGVRLAPGARKVAHIEPANPDAVIRILDVDAGKETFAFTSPGHASSRGSCFSADGNLFVTWNAELNVRFWNLTK